VIYNVTNQLEIISSFDDLPMPVREMWLLYHNGTRDLRFSWYNGDHDYFQSVSIRDRKLILDFLPSPENSIWMVQLFVDEHQHQHLAQWRMSGALSDQEARLFAELLGEEYLEREFPKYQPGYR